MYSVHATYDDDTWLNIPKPTTCVREAPVDPMASMGPSSISSSSSVNRRPRLPTVSVAMASTAVTWLIPESGT
jgi:hypothetical protein